MPTRTRFKTTRNIPTPPTQIEVGPITEDLARVLTSVLEAIVRFMSGYIYRGDGSDGSWTGHLDGQYLDVLTPTTTSTTFPQPHGLGRVPVGFVVLDRNGVQELYRAPDKDHTDKVLWLRSDTASASFKIEVF